MPFLDILFPVNLGPLTYRCPDGLSERAEPGMVVSAQLRNKIKRGIIMGRALSTPTGEVKDILAVHGDIPFMSTKMITLLKWMAEYYLSEQGLILKNMLPREAFTKIKKKKTKIRQTTAQPLSPVNINDRAVSRVLDTVKKGTYETFLLQAPSFAYEYSFLIRVLSEVKNIIVLVPEVSLTNDIYPVLNEKFGDRVCLFHSGLSGGERSEAVDRILSGKSDIVVGTRSVIFTPLKQVSFIAVLNEHSSSYKQEDGLRYHGRDVAVMRAYLERTTILLSSICPSFESLYNCRRGKYTLLKPESAPKKPRVKIIDMRHERLLKPYLSRKVIDAAMKYIRENSRVMFVINRRGYSTFLQCAECNYVEECTACNVPLIFHKQDLLVKCHYCGYSIKVPERCSRCRSYNIQFLGAGTERVQEDIEKLAGMKTLRFDSDTSRKRSDVESIIGYAHNKDVKILVGTKILTKRLGMDSGFSMAVLLNTDISLHLPDFRSTEKVYQEIMSIEDRVVTSGEIFIQTKMPQNYLFQCIKNYDYHGFFSEELSRRKSLHYPPHTRLLLLRFISRRDMCRELSDVIRGINKCVEILGPSPSKNKQGKCESKLLLKSSVRGALHAAAKSIIEQYKGSKEVTLKVDVDPISI